MIVRMRNFSPSPHDLLHAVHSFPWKWQLNYFLWSFNNYSQPTFWHSTIGRLVVRVDIVGSFLWVVTWPFGDVFNSTTIWLATRRVTTKSMIVMAANFCKYKKHRDGKYKNTLPSVFLMNSLYRLFFDANILFDLMQSIIRYRWKVLFVFIEERRCVVFGEIRPNSLHSFLRARWPNWRRKCQTRSHPAV